MLWENNTTTNSKIKNKISMDLKRMNFGKIKKYLKRQSTELQTEQKQHDCLSG